MCVFFNEQFQNYCVIFKEIGCAKFVRNGIQFGGMCLNISLAVVRTVIIRVEAIWFSENDLSGKFPPPAKKVLLL